MYKKIGIFGGTFDPIHTGHLILAETAYDIFKLDKILIMPTAEPPHKKDVSKVFHRSAMAQIICSDNPHFEYSGFEMERKGSTYTADTLTLLKKENPLAEYFFIIGADSLFSMETWKAPDVVFQCATILAAQRNDFNNNKLIKQIEYLTKKYQSKIHLIDIPNIEISSTMITEKIKKGESIRYYVPDQIIEYINRNNLYKD